MLSFELLARVRKELFITGSALYETIVAMARGLRRSAPAARYAAGGGRQTVTLPALTG